MNFGLDASCCVNPFRYLRGGRRGIIVTYVHIIICSNFIQIL